MTKRRLTRSNIGYADPDDPRPVYGWNPAPGCTRGCDGCWARRMASRSKCELCHRFQPHLHLERLAEPINTKKPGVALVNLMGELFDGDRSVADINRVMVAADIAYWHTYVFLTQQSAVARIWSKAHKDHPNWYLGRTYRTQAELDADEVFFTIPGNKWLSLEPLRDFITIDKLSELCGVIVGCDSRRGTPFSIDWYNFIVSQCADAGVKCYVKQLWIRGELVTNPDFFPPELRVRQLPWSKP